MKTARCDKEFAAGQLLWLPVNEPKLRPSKRLWSFRIVFLGLEQDIPVRKVGVQTNVQMVLTAKVNRYIQIVKPAAALGLGQRSQV